MTRAIFLLFLFMVCSSYILFGQSELEIKTTGKYIYSWAIESDVETAMEKARLDLLDTIFVSILKEKAMDKTDTIFIKVIDYFQKKVGFKWEVVAFADKEDIKVKLETLKKLKVIPVIIGEHNIAGKSVLNNAEGKEQKNIETGKTETSISSDTMTLVTGNQVLDELLSVRDENSLKRILSKYKLELKLNYGNKSNFSDPAGCYIFVINPQSKQLIAVYDKGKDSRKNFFTKAEEANYLEKHKNEYLIYVVLI